MLVMPILHRGKIYNVEVKLKSAYAVQATGAFQKLFESDIIVNGQSFNQSSYYQKDSSLTSIISFIRDHSLYASNSFFLTSRRNNQGKMNSYHVTVPLPRVTEGLDALYSSVIQNMKKEIPGHQKDRHLSLKKLGVTSHITEEKVSGLQKIVEKGEQSVDDIFQDDETNQLSQTLEFVRQFECRVIEDATVDEKVLQSLLDPFRYIHTKESKELNDYYLLAKENKEEYGKLDQLARVLTGDSLRWIRREKNIMKIKRQDYYDRKVG